MKTIIVKNNKEGAKKAASIISEQIRKNPSSVLGLATGETMIPVYNELAKKDLNFSKIKTVNLDEYIGLSWNNKNSFHFFMKKYLFNKTNINLNNTYFPGEKSKKFPKIDLQILGIGIIGHIGFNEPGSKANSRKRKIRLSESTRKANSRFFGFFGKVPKEAYTLGIKDILESKKIILLAFGKDKAEAIRKTIEEKISEETPASFLRKHKNVTLILDKSAASNLSKIKLK